MGAEVIITGTGIPAPVHPERAGSGIVVRVDGTILQVDAGTGTTLRLRQLGIPAPDITALLLTHHHSDHLVGLDDLVMERWLVGGDEADPALPVVAPVGPCVRFAERLLDLWEDDIRVRQELSGTTTRPSLQVQAFDPPAVPRVVWSSGDVSVSAVTVHHEPVVPAVGYRVHTPYGDIAISGDTRLCDEVEELAAGARVLVHEVVCRSAAQRALGDYPSRFDYISRYHTEATELGALAARLEVPVVMLTHLIPQPVSEADEQAFVDDLRAGGYEGEVVVSRDLDRWAL